MFFGLFTRKPKIVTVKRKAKPKNGFQAHSPKKKRLKKVRAKKGITRAKKRRKPAVKKVKKIARLKAAKSLRPAKTMPKIVGKVTHYFPHVRAGVILITNGTIALGDTLQIKGHTTEFKQKVNSMQINNIPIKEAKAGQEIGLLVKSRVRHSDVVYKL